MGSGFLDVCGHALFFQGERDQSHFVQVLFMFSLGFPPEKRATMAHITIDTKGVNWGFKIRVSERFFVSVTPSAVAGWVTVNYRMGYSEHPTP